MRGTAMAVLAVGLALGAARADESAEDRLRRAFPGDDAPGRAPIKVVWQDQGAVFAAQELRVLPDSGQVRLVGCHLVRSAAGPDAGPVAVRARSVVLTYDAPIRRMEDLAGRKVVWASADLGGGARLDFSRP